MDLRVLLVAIVIWVLIATIFLDESEEEKKAKETNPELSTRDWDFHLKRINTYGSSRYRGRMYYLGPKGGYYYYSANGNKVYC